MENSITHIPVLLNESIEILSITAGDTIVDGTFGGGGHSKKILENYGTTVDLVCVDLDEAAHERFKESILASKATFVAANFKDASDILHSAHKTSVHKVLLDLGTSTFQLLKDTRGFSFSSNSPLTMTFSEKGSHTGFTASEIVNTWQLQSLTDIISGYGEEKRAWHIAQAIIQARIDGPITTSAQLAAIIQAKIPRKGRIHPATKSFQALRIAVNDEMQVLQQALDAWWTLLEPQGRLAVITFHSIEDRIVKHWMKAQGKSITKKPIIPGEEELSSNPRSRSAKLRCIEKNS